MKGYRTERKIEEEKRGRKRETVSEILEREKKEKRNRKKIEKNKEKREKFNNS